MESLDGDYQTTCRLAQAVHCPAEQTQALDAVSKHRAKIHSLSQAIQVILTFIELHTQTWKVIAVTEYSILVFVEKSKVIFLTN